MNANGVNICNACKADIDAVSQCELIVHPAYVKTHGAKPNNVRLRLFTPKLSLYDDAPYSQTRYRAALPVISLSLDEFRQSMESNPCIRSGKPEGTVHFLLGTLSHTSQ